MKKLITLLFFALLISANSYSQTTRKYEYATVYYEPYKDKIFIFYGENQIVDFHVLKNIKPKEDFVSINNSTVDALNYMDEQGYDLVSSTSDQYTFRREIKK